MCFTYTGPSWIWQAMRASEWEAMLSLATIDYHTLQAIECIRAERAAVTEERLHRNASRGSRATGEVY